MATFITIIDTVKEGFFTIDTNVLYLNGAVKTKRMNVLKSSITEINIQKDSLNNEFLDIQTENAPQAFSITNDINQSRYYPIESINGVTPTSIDHLENLILNLR